MLAAIALLVLTFNKAADLYGPVDTRPSTWGHAEHVDWWLNVPDDIIIVRISGDVVAWPTTKGAGPAIVEPGRYAGYLFGAWHGRSWPGIDNTFIYHQGVVSQQPSRIEFDRPLNLRVRGGRLWFRLASWLNDTGYPIHLEATFTIYYREVRDAKSSRDQWSADVR